MQPGSGRFAFQRPGLRGSPLYTAAQLR